MYIVEGQCLYINLHVALLTHLILIPPRKKNLDSQNRDFMFIFILVDPVKQCYLKWENRN